MQTQSRQKYTKAMIKRLPKKNQKYYVLDSEVIGLRIYVQISGEKFFYLQRYLKEFKYSNKTKIGDFPEMSIRAARKIFVKKFIFFLKFLLNNNYHHYYL